ncbi:MAG TPA: zinc-binding dehydrogenase [Rhodothermales bacterium]|nr:zinc-binding dehydrogenase [Rhodothermales bacterium]
MKAVQLTRIGEPFEDREVPRPNAGPGEVVVRVSAAGICHSDAHYRAGTSPVGRLPITPGHEVAGVVEEIGEGVDETLLARRVCVHYLVTCGACRYCTGGQEQFCPSGQMVGKHRDGGFAEFVSVPARNVVSVPDNVSDAEAAIMMCSTATAFHAIRQVRLMAGETIAIIGCGGLGMSAIQIARNLGAGRVLAVDIDEKKLAMAAGLGAEPIDGRDQPADRVREATAGRGVDAAIELIGAKSTFELAVEILAPKGRAALAGLSNAAIDVRPYPDLINREAEIIGVSDHLLSELVIILDWASRGKLNLKEVVSRSIPLRSDAVNAVLDDLERGTSSIRSVIAPTR